MVLLEFRFQNTPPTRFRNRPLRSIASMVLAKVGASGLPVIASISAMFSAMPWSKAGGKCSARMRSKGGRPKGVVQVSKNGLLIRAPC